MPWPTGLDRARRRQRGPSPGSVGAVATVVLGGVLSLSGGPRHRRGRDGLGGRRGNARSAPATPSTATVGRWLARRAGRRRGRPRSARAVALRPDRGWRAAARRTTSRRRSGSSFPLQAAVAAGGRLVERPMTEPGEDLVFRRPVDGRPPAHRRRSSTSGGAAGGMRALLPRLWFEHFAGTSWIAEDADGPPVAASSSRSSARTTRTTGYVHMIAADPEPAAGRASAGPCTSGSFADARAHGARRVHGRHLARQPDLDRVPPRDGLPRGRRTGHADRSTARRRTPTTTGPARTGSSSSAISEGGIGPTREPAGRAGGVMGSEDRANRARPAARRTLPMFRRLAAAVAALALILLVAAPALAGGWAEIVADARTDRNRRPSKGSRSRWASPSSSTARRRPAGRSRPSTFTDVADRRDVPGHGRRIRSGRSLRRDRHDADRRVLDVDRLAPGPRDRSRSRTRSPSTRPTGIAPALDPAMAVAAIDRARRDVTTELTGTLFAEMERVNDQIDRQRGGR